MSVAEDAAGAAAGAGGGAGTDAGLPIVYVEGHNVEAIDELLKDQAAGIPAERSSGIGFTGIFIEQLVARDTMEPATKIKREDRAEILPRFGLPPDFLDNNMCKARLLPSDVQGHRVAVRRMKNDDANLLLADAQARGVDILEVTVERVWRSPTASPCRPPTELDAECEAKLKSPGTSLGISIMSRTSSTSSYFIALYAPAAERATKPAK